jgi:hypothetical protein
MFQHNNLKNYACGIKLAATSKSTFMKEREDNMLPQDKDRHLDIPQEARRDKHINFLDVEDTSDDNENRDQRDEETLERQKQWREGIEEGKRMRRNSE